MATLIVSFPGGLPPDVEELVSRYGVEPEVTSTRGITGLQFAQLAISLSSVIVPAVVQIVLALRKSHPGATVTLDTEVVAEVDEEKLKVILRRKTASGEDKG